MSRWMILALCLVLGAALTAACAGGDSATSPPPTQQATEPAADATEPAGGAVSATSEPAQPSPAQSSPAQSSIEVGYKVGQQAPDFTLTTAAGEDLALDSLQGRPVILYFFATW